MDKFDTLVEVMVAKAAPDEQAEVRAVMVAVADFGRTVEQIGADIDRIASALEKITEKING